MAFQEFVEARPADDVLAISPRQPPLPYPHHLMGEGPGIINKGETILAIPDWLHQK
jgi:hypothetical protein